MYSSTIYDIEKKKEIKKKETQKQHKSLLKTEWINNVRYGQQWNTLQKWDWMIYNQLPATTCNKYQIYYLEQKNLNTRRICFYSCTVFKTVKLIYAIRRVIPGGGWGEWTGESTLEFSEMLGMFVPWSWSWLQMCSVYKLIPLSLYLGICLLFCVHVILQQKCQKRGKKLSTFCTDLPPIHSPTL